MIRPYAAVLVAYFTGLVVQPLSQPPGLQWGAVAVGAVGILTALIILRESL